MKPETSVNLMKNAAYALNAFMGFSGTLVAPYVNPVASAICMASNAASYLNDTFFNSNTIRAAAHIARGAAAAATGIDCLGGVPEVLEDPSLSNVLETLSNGVLGALMVTDTYAHIRERK